MALACNIYKWVLGLAAMDNNFLANKRENLNRYFGLVIAFIVANSLTFSSLYIAMGESINTAYLIYQVYLMQIGQVLSFIFIYMKLIQIQNLKIVEYNKSYNQMSIQICFDPVQIRKANKDILLFFFFIVQFLIL